MREEAESSASARRRDVGRKSLSDSPAVVLVRRTSAKNPPPYGAQHRQKALWEGGNDALPPGWQRYKVLDGTMLYQDDSLAMTSWKRPLPGARLDDPGDLVVSRCEWHISPLGRSYFVNHNTRTTSWKKPTPTRPAGCLMPEYIIEGHSKCVWSLACIGPDCDIISTSDDTSIRQWRRGGEAVGKPWRGDGGGVQATAVSPDETAVVSGSIDGRLRLWNVKGGRMVRDPWEGHNAPVTCLDWSPNALEIASGSEDGTIRRWNPDTGQQIAPPIEISHGWLCAVKYSAQGDKFASGGEDKMIRVWTMAGELLIEIKGHENTVSSLCWSKDGAHFFSASFDGTIRKWCSIGGQEIVVLQGHTKSVTSISLTPDECYLVSASSDCSVHIWDLKIIQPVGDPLLHDDQLFTVAMSPDGKYITSAGSDAKIYVWSLEAALQQQGHDNSADDGNAKHDTKLKGRADPSKDIFDARRLSKQQANNRGLAKYGNDFWNTDINRAPHRATPAASPSSPPHWRNLFGSLGFSIRSTNIPQSIPLQPRRRNFSLFPVGISSHPVNVAPARDEDRYGIAPETDEEVAAAMQRLSGNNADSSTQQGQPTGGEHGSQGRPTQSQDSTGGAGDIIYEGVSCCGFFFGRRRPTSHQS